MLDFGGCSTRPGCYFPLTGAGPRPPSPQRILEKKIVARLGWAELSVTGRRHHAASGGTDEEGRDRGSQAEKQGWQDEAEARPFLRMAG